MPMEDFADGPRVQCRRLDTVLDDWALGKGSRSTEFSPGEMTVTYGPRLRSEDDRPLVEVAECSKVFARNDSLVDLLLGDRE